MLITDTHTDEKLKCNFRIQGTSKRVNPSKSPFRKFDPKTILFLLIGKRKQKGKFLNDFFQNENYLLVDI